MKLVRLEDHLENATTENLRTDLDALSNIFQDDFSWRNLLENRYYITKDKQIYRVRSSGSPSNLKMRDVTTICDDTVVRINVRNSEQCIFISKQTDDAFIVHRNSAATIIYGNDGFAVRDHQFQKVWHAYSCSDRKVTSTTNLFEVANIIIGCILERDIRHPEGIFSKDELWDDADEIKTSTSKLSVNIPSLVIFPGYEKVVTINGKFDYVSRDRTVISKVQGGMRQDYYVENGTLKTSPRSLYTDNRNTACEIPNGFDQCPTYPKNDITVPITSKDLIEDIAKSSWIFGSIVVIYDRFDTPRIVLEPRRRKQLPLRKNETTHVSRSCVLQEGPYGIMVVNADHNSPKLITANRIVDFREFIKNGANHRDGHCNNNVLLTWTDKSRVYTIIRIGDRFRGYVISPFNNEVIERPLRYVHFDDEWVMHEGIDPRLSTSRQFVEVFDFIDESFVVSLHNVNIDLNNSGAGSSDNLTRCRGAVIIPGRAPNDFYLVDSFGSYLITDYVHSSVDSESKKLVPKLKDVFGVTVEIDGEEKDHIRVTLEYYDHESPDDDIKDPVSAAFGVHRNSVSFVIQTTN